MTDKLIILDYRSGRVVILPSIIEDHEQQVTAWADKNSTNVNDCNWMVWDGEIDYQESAENVRAFDEHHPACRIYSGHSCNCILRQIFGE